MGKNPVHQKVKSVVKFYKNWHKKEIHKYIKKKKWNLAAEEHKTPETCNNTINVYILSLHIQVLLNTSPAE